MIAPTNAPSASFAKTVTLPRSTPLIERLPPASVCAVTTPENATVFAFTAPLTVVDPETALTAADLAIAEDWPFVVVTPAAADPKKPAEIPPVR